MYGTAGPVAEAAALPIELVAKNPAGDGSGAPAKSAKSKGVLVVVARSFQDVAYLHHRQELDLLTALSLQRDC